LSKQYNETIKLEGNVNKENIEEIINAIDNSVNKVIITSGGGEVVSNIRLAKLIREKGIEIEVDGYCMSSCFNYIFLASVKRSIQNSAVLEFHGGVETTLAKESLPDFILRLSLSPLNVPIAVNYLV